MKGELIGKFFGERLFSQRGFSTIEVLIAFVVIIVSLSAAASISFGAQSLLIDSEFNLSAISRIEEVLEKSRSLFSEDFESFILATSTVDGFYQEKVDILNITPCVKKISVMEAWKQEGVSKELSFSQIFTSPPFFEKIREPCSGDETLIQDWQKYDEQIFPTDIEGVTDVDVVGDLFFISSNAGTTADSDLFIFDSKKSYEKIAELDIGKGIFAIDATSEYVYVVTDATSSQFMIIDVSDPYVPVVVSERNLFGVDPFGSYPQGRSIKYFDGRVYIGTKETAGPEFHIFNVENPVNPYQIGYIEVTHNINDIDVRDGIAYLATSADTKELIVMDVNIPSAMQEVGYFNAGTSAVNDRDATAIYLLGKMVYLGRKRGAVLNPEFYMIDISNPLLPKKYSDFNLALSGITSYVSGIVASSNLVFISTTDSTQGFFILNVSDPENIEKVSSQYFSHPLSSIDMASGYGEGEANIFSVDLSNGDIYEIQK
ncbi:MAG: hypothetical protein U0522_02470 [Candidatus Paceibacterota bacterium]